MRIIRLLMTLVICAAAAAITYLYIGTHIHKSETKTIKVSGQPTLGSSAAPVHLIVFEEPYCTACRAFTKNITPVVISRFIGSGEVALTVVPVSFLPHSLPLAEAWLSVYYQNPSRPNADLFFQFVDYSYAHQPAESTILQPKQLVQMAERVSSKIDGKVLADSLARNLYRSQVEENTKYAKELLGGQLATPALFINGRLIDDLSLNNVMTEIHERLAKHHTNK